MDVNWKIWVLLANGSNQESCSLWLQNTGHIFNTKDVDLEGDKFFNQAQVVLQVVLLLWIQHYTNEMLAKEH